MEGSAATSELIRADLFKSSFRKMYKILRGGLLLYEGVLLFI